MDIWLCTYVTSYNSHLLAVHSTPQLSLTYTLYSFISCSLLHRSILNGKVRRPAHTVSSARIAKNSSSFVVDCKIHDIHLPLSCQHQIP